MSQNEIRYGGKTCINCSFRAPFSPHKMHEIVGGRELTLYIFIRIKIVVHLASKIK